MADWSIQLDSVELVSSIYNVSRVLDDTTAERSINIIETAGIEGAVIVDDRFGSKTIRMEGTLIGSSASDLQTKIDILNELFARKNVNLDVLPPSGETRRYVVRLIGEIEYKRQFFHNDYVPFVARFFVAEGVGKATSSINAHTDPNTVAERRPAASSDTASFLGSAIPKPIIKFVIDTLGKLDLITFTDDDNSKEMFIDIDTEFASADIVKIDLDEQSVKRERAGVDTVIPFRGEFPDFVIGSNNFHVDFQGATYVADQSQVDTGTGSVIGNTGALTRNLAQSFIAGESGYLSRLTLNVSKTGTPGSLQVRVFTDNGGRPDQNLVSGETGFLEAEGSFGAQADVNLDDSTPPYYLRKGVKYWLILTTTDNSGNFYTLFGSGTTDNYTDGELLKNDDSVMPPADPADYDDFTSVIEDLRFVTHQGQGGAVDWQVDVDIDYTKRYL